MKSKIEHKLKNFIVDTTWDKRFIVYKAIDYFIFSNNPTYNLTSNVTDIPLIKKRIEAIFKNFKVQLVELSNSADDHLINEPCRFSFNVLDRKSRKRYKVLVGEFINNSNQTLYNGNQAKLF